MGQNIEEMDTLLQDLQTEYKVVSSSIPTSFLGIQIKIQNSNIFLSQEKYTKNIS